MARIHVPLIRPRPRPKPTDPQSQSSLLRLPREIRDAIYLEVWRTHGLRQHILSHNEWNPKEPPHLCHWPCTTEFSVEDNLQQDAELLRLRPNSPISDGIREKALEMRLISPWMNHWACGECAEEVYGSEAIESTSTFGMRCWKNRRQPPPRSPYLPMLLSCKLISEECLKSIYESTTFVFTDARTVQKLVGFCEYDRRIGRPKRKSTPQIFPKLAKSLEISLTPIFPLSIPCSAPLMSPHPEALHDPYDFHWLRLDRFEKLQRVKIWVASRGAMRYVFSKGEERHSPGCTKLVDLDRESLKTALSSFAHIQEFVMSAALHKDIGPEDGNVEGITQPRHRLWKRGTGDAFHPYLTGFPSRARCRGAIRSSETRTVEVHYSMAARTVCRRPGPLPWPLIVIGLGIYLLIEAPRECFDSVKGKMRDMKGRVVRNKTARFRGNESDGH
ncbi:hypothetical protein ACJZ2D_004260 [Fusarium nematophilum]